MAEQKKTPPVKRGKIEFKEVDPSRYPEFEARLRNARREIEGEQVIVEVTNPRQTRLVIVLVVISIVSSVAAILLALRWILWG